MSEEMWEKNWRYRSHFALWVPFQLESEVVRMAQEKNIEFHAGYPVLNYRIYSFYAMEDTKMEDIIKLLETHMAIDKTGYEP